LPGLDPAAARRLLASATAAGGWLSALDAMALLQALGIEVAPTRPVCTQEDALTAYHELGPAIVLKGTGASILHKTEARAVRTELGREDAVRHAWLGLQATAGVTQVLAQPMLRGAEMLVGATLDPTFGHVIVCGTGGTMTELLKDSVCRLHPITESTARDMLDSIRGIALVRGFRGAPRGDEAALRQVLLRVSALIDACPEIVELDLNPVLVNAAGATVVDARIRVAR
jgi:acetyltransferase